MTLEQVYSAHILIHGARVLRDLDILRSKMPVLVAIAAIAFALIVGVHRHHTLSNAWLRLHIPSTSPNFADTRTITNSIDCVLAGQDPYTVRSFDPWYRLYNYPPVWLKLQYLGVTSRASNLIGTILACFLIAAVLCLFRAKTWLTACIIFLALTSKAILFAFERGNTDQIIFALLVFGLFLIDRQRVQLRSPLTATLIALLTILKIYPVVAVIVFFRSRNGIAKAMLTVTISIAALILTSGRSLPILLANTPRDTEMSFGSFPFFQVIGRHIFASAQSAFATHHRAAPLGAILLGAFPLAAGSFYRDRLDKFLPTLDFNHARGRIALCGLIIFCFAFIANSSYEYRLLYLLGPLACLSEDLDRRSSRRSIFPVVLILLLMCGPLHPTFFHEITDGLVYIIAITWLTSSLFRSAGGWPIRKTQTIPPVPYSSSLTA